MFRRSRAGHHWQCVIKMYGYPPPEYRCRLISTFFCTYRCRNRSICHIRYDIKCIISTWKHHLHIITFRVKNTLYSEEELEPVTDTRCEDLPSPRRRRHDDVESQLSLRQQERAVAFVLPLAIAFALAPRTSHLSCPCSGVSFLPRCSRRHCRWPQAPARTRARARG